MRNSKAHLLKLALLPIGGIGADDGFMKISVLARDDIGKPFEGGSGPLDRSGKKKVILVWGFFFPNFILLVDDHLFFLVMV